MPDIVVTLPKRFGIVRWVEEGDVAGDTWTGRYYEFSIGGAPDIAPGEKVYVVYDKMLIGYAPLVERRVERTATGGHRTFLVRGGEACAVTIDQEIKGFQGYRYRWWNLSDERPFYDWKEKLIGGPNPTPDPKDYLKE